MKLLITSKHKIYLLISLAIVAFFGISYFSNLAYDDFNYKFMYDKLGLTSNRVVSLVDIFVSQYNHYFVFNGRVIVHFFVQLFLISDHKIWFDLVNSSIFGFFLILILKHTSFDKKSYSGYVVVVLVVVLWFLVSGQNYCMFWLSGSVNYLWSVTAALLLLYVKRKLLIREFKAYQIFGIFFVAFFLNSMHEVISISIVSSLILELIVFRYYYNKGLIALNLGALGGALFVSLAPSNFMRLALTASVETNNFQSVIAANDSHLLIVLNAIKIFFLVGLLFLYVLYKDKKIFAKLIRQNFVFIVSIVVSFLFVYAVKGFNQRAIFPAVIFAVIILVSIIQEFDYVLLNKGVKLAILFISLLMIVEYGNVISELIRNKQTFHLFDAKLRNSAISQTVFEAPELIKNRFMCFTGLGGTNRFSVPNIGLSRVYGKPYVILLPSSSFQELEMLSRTKQLNNKRTALLHTNQNTVFVKLPDELCHLDLAYYDVFVQSKVIGKPTAERFNYGVLDNRLFLILYLKSLPRNQKMDKLYLVENFKKKTSLNPYK